MYLLYSKYKIKYTKQQSSAGDTKLDGNVLLLMKTYGT